ncbi:hypothetical protein HGRIS_010003 [Hohenbuehelia grisea]|uniref:Uncharacterized protein n=1 Tax=Hohenbuehelia grisea TaxID=104357 RepID=A0ABR3J4E8_9AGAR
MATSRVQALADRAALSIASSELTSGKQLICLGLFGFYAGLRVVICHWLQERFSASKPKEFVSAIFSRPKSVIALGFIDCHKLRRLVSLRLGWRIVGGQSVVDDTEIITA